MTKQAKSEPQKHVLIVSTGNQDIKVLCTREIEKGAMKLIAAEIDRTEFGGESVRREFHRQLQKGNVRHRMVSDDSDLPAADETDVANLGSLDWSEEKRAFIKIDGRKNPFELKRDCFNGNITTPLKTNNNEYLLFPAKLHSVVKKLKKNEVKVEAVLVFYTDRDFPGNQNNESDAIRNLRKKYYEEPIATGLIIANWLAKEFRLTSNPNEGADFTNFKVCHVNYLKGLYAFEGNHVLNSTDYSAYEQPIALRAIHIIDSAIKTLRNHNTQQNAIISHTGGIADTKSVITPSARLHFHGNIQENHDSEFLPDLICFDKSCNVPPRNAILDAKHHAIQRLWEGDFAGTWAVVSHIENNDKELKCDGWVNSIREAANFMEGWREFDRETIAPVSEDLINTGVDKLLWLAFKIEASLQNNTGEPLISETLRYLNTFREKVMEYLLLLLIERNNGVWSDIEINLKTWELKKTDGSRTINGTQTNLKIDEDNYINTRHMGSVFNFFQESFQNTEEFKYYLSFSELLEKDISSNRVSKSNTIRYYRNKLTHNILPPATIKNIEQYGNSSGLWQTSPNKQDRKNLGSNFLSTKYVQNIFNVVSSGVDHVAIYKNFVVGVLDTIQTPIPEKCPDH